MDYDWAKWDFHCKRKKRTIYTNIIPFRQGFFFWGKGSLSLALAMRKKKGVAGENAASQWMMTQLCSQNCEMQRLFGDDKAIFGCVKKTFCCCCRQIFKRPHRAWLGEKPPFSFPFLYNFCIQQNKAHARGNPGITYYIGKPSGRDIPPMFAHCKRLADPLHGSLISVLDVLLSDHATPSLNPLLDLHLAKYMQVTKDVLNHTENPLHIVCITRGSH